MDAHKAIELSKLTTILVKKISRKILISRSVGSVSRILRALKRLGIKKKNRGVRKKVVEIMVFVA